jgi:succinate dehydrogenase / fumarate reductase iron-sulfur subunit|tara:strand:- start:2409 stop:3155 length:747 start_codon:yes stop_codon:yes gene_type:complete
MTDYNVHVWRQSASDKLGYMERHRVTGITDDMSFLEMLDVLNESLQDEGKEPIAFDHDCREGICGACSLVINGQAHGPETTTTCQLHMRSIKGTDIFIEPWRAAAFPVLKDCVVDRSSFDRIIQAGGFVSVNTGNAPDANANAIVKEDAETAFDAAACIGCGACVAACKNASAMLFVSAKVSHLAHLPQGNSERKERVTSMVETMDKEGFGSCTNFGECEAACPKSISTDNIGVLNREFVRAKAGSTT